jgi:predicted acetyltransferase
LEQSYRSFVAALTSPGERLVPFTLSFQYERFEDPLKKLSDNARGVGLPEGFVPHSSYWLVSVMASGQASGNEATEWKFSGIPWQRPALSA